MPTPRRRRPPTAVRIARTLLRRNPEYGSVLLGSPGQAQWLLRLRVQVIMSIAAVASNIVGVVAAIALGAWGIREPLMWGSNLWWVNYVVLPVYVCLAVGIGTLVGTTSTLRLLRWATDRNQAPTLAQARSALTVPRRLTTMIAGLWIVGAALLMTCYGIVNPRLIVKVGFIVPLTGFVVCSVTYLMVEFANRPVAARALAVTPEQSTLRGGLVGRTLLTWVAGSGAPLLGIVVLAIGAVIFNDVTRTSMIIGAIVLACTALVTGLLLNVLNLNSIIAPIRSVRRGMAGVRRGDTSTRLVVFDGTDLGDLQVGFNAMVDGLAERERLHDLFDRHVGRDVANAALANSVSLGGDRRTVAVLFVDIIGSTTLATQRSPEEVVAILNTFFAVIVNEVDNNNGLVNKFQGDAVLAIFGAPLDIDDPATAALRTARAVSDKLTRLVTEVQAGIGVSYGDAVAGNVGAIQRFEYTVIGDAVNEAARLSEVAKDNPRSPAASGRAVQAASSAEQRFWQPLDTRVLRGRGEPTEIFGTGTVDPAAGGGVR